MAFTKNNKILLIDLHTFPCINYYKILVNYHKLKIEQYEHFQKGSYSNRFYIAGANGRILLSIPLSHSGRERIPFKDLRISNRDKWQLIHWRTLVSAYRRSPWFEFYEDDLHRLYANKFEFLLDWNMQAFDMVNQWTGWEWEISHTGEYFKFYPDENMEDVRNSILPKNVMNNSQFDFPRYHQVFEEKTGFLPGLSILDLLFCEGRRGVEMIESIGGAGIGKTEGT